MAFFHIPHVTASVVISDAVSFSPLCLCTFAFWFDSLSVYVRVSGLVWSTAEDLRGLVGAARQRRTESTPQHHDS